MGQSENNTNHREHNSVPKLEALETVQKLTTELQALHSDVLNSLQEDVKQLVHEKNRLRDDIQKLQVQKDNLHSSQIEQQQQVLIRQLVQVLSNHVSIQLQSSLEQLFESAIVRVSNNSMLQSSTQTEKSLSSTNHSEVEDLLVLLKAAVSKTFEELSLELNNYQSNFSVQLSQMYSNQEQGEAILAELVYRLRNELEKSPQQPNYNPNYNIGSNTEELPQLESSEAFDIESTVLKSASDYESPFVDNTPKKSSPDTVIPNPITRAQIAASIEPIEPIEPIETIETAEFVSREDTATEEVQKLQSAIRTQLPPETIVPTPIPTPSIRRKRVEPKQSLPPKPPETEVGRRELPTTLRTGFLLVMLSVVASALYNVSIKAMFFPKSQIFGVFDVNQLISPTLGNCFLILMLRMLVVVPLMFVLAPIMHQGIWQDITGLINSLRNKTVRPNTTQVSQSRTMTKRILLLSVISGFFLFLSQVLIYLAIGQVATGVAISLFFIYPVISGFFGWLLFKTDRERPTLSRISTIACICFGQLLVLGSNTSNPNISFGSTAAIASGITFAIYIVLTRICAARLHPVSFTLLNFSTMLLLCFVALMIPLPANIGVQVNYNNFLELILSAFILGVLTLFGYVLNNLGIRKFGATRSALIGACVPALTVIFAGLIIQESLELIQVIGVLVVTVGAAAFNLEKIRSRSKSSKTIA